MSAAVGIPGAVNPRLKTAAHEFEASLMKEFLKPLEHDPLFSSGTQDGTGDDGGEGSDNALMGFGAESLAMATSERGGFGIADRILSHFEAKQESGVAKASDSEDSPGMGGKR